MLREIEISSLDSTPTREGETREGENPPNMRSGKEVTFTGGPGKRSSAGDLVVDLALVRDNIGIHIQLFSFYSAGL